MAKVAWDRLLETCQTRDADVALLVPGSPPLLRVGETWRALGVPAIEKQDVADLVSELREPDGQMDGYAYRYFWYRNVAFFHTMAFGYPDTVALVVSRAAPPRPPAADPPGPNVDA